MDENTKLYFDVIKEQFEMAKSRLTPLQLEALREGLTDLVEEDTFDDSEEVEEEEEWEEDEDA